MTKHFWIAPCPICGEAITHANAAAHLRAVHKMKVSGVGPHGLSMQALDKAKELHDAVQRSKK